ncbi:murein hydrolase activator EnvC family protein [Anaerocolumna sp. MB42-C2]|uniref:murein hydrolase activator EnvC family protein n=1 Tax=Anaerocolumna sp. MB42-C2 TaxID=3070997 RepID=UPI0027E0D63C|nr:peptidoglycan DD-metalloendopeptidase family protein [Anaerocolumna sp. MB42-C2]WMJ90311.1 peptidoglycan DD-metalloendopeptidase family protein [Anaerocolumna sp. MB42-C2]
MEKRHFNAVWEDAKHFLCKTKEKTGKKRIQGILILLSVIMLVGSLTFPSFATEIDRAKDVKSDLEKKKQETESRLSELEKEKGDILKYIEELDKELTNLNDEIDSLNTDIKKTDKALTKARKEFKAAKVIEEDQYSIMKKRIQYMYENGDTDYLEIIMKSDNLSDVLNQVEYMSKITEYDNGLLDKYKKLKQDVADKEKNLEDKIAELNALKEQLTYEQDTVKKLASDKNKELVKYEASIDQTQALSAEYTSKLSEQEDLIEDLLEAERKRIEEEERKKKEEAERRRKEEERKRQEEAAKANNASSQNSNSNTDNDTDSNTDNDSGSQVKVDGFIWPCPSSTRITSTFGNREQPTEGASTYHKGIDIGASTGSSIVAAAGGSVVTAAYSVSAGNYIMIYHGDGIYTVYMHCSKLLVSAGEEVSQGQTIALVGSTGVSTGSHLHFGVSVNGTYVNPLNYVSY